MRAHPTMWLSLAIAGLLLTPSIAAAQVPGTLPIQGVLSDAGGTPLEGGQTIQLRLYDAETGGTTLHNETQVVTCASGVFTAYLGTNATLDLGIFDGQSLWLGVKVGADAEMTPRLALGSVPYAAYSGNAAALGGVAAASYLTTASQATIEGWAAGVCYNTEAELTALLDNNYAPSGHTHGSADIIDGSLTSADILDGTITGADIANATIATADLANNAVTSALIADGTIATADLANGAVTSALIADGTIASADIADETITTTDILNGTITSNDIFDGTIIASDIASGNITSAHVLNATLVAADVSSTGGIYASKTSLYRNTGAATAIVNNSTGSASVACNDTNDLPLQGSCYMTGSSQVFITSQLESGWTSDAAVATVTCWGQNNSGANQNLTASITCVAKL